MSTSGQKTPGPSLLAGLAWTSALRWAAQVVAWSSTLILVRVLSPTDYGVVAVAAAVIAWVTGLADLGLSGSIQTAEVQSPEAYGKMLGQSLTSGLAFAGFIAVLGPFLAVIFKQDSLRLLLPVMSLCILLDGVRAVLSSIMMRSLQNRSLAALDLARSVSQTLVVFACAIMGFGFWSLAIGQVTASVLGAVMIQTKLRIKPSRPTLAQFRASLVRGKHFMTTGMMWQTYVNADVWVLGRVLGPAAVGAYSLARTLASMPSDKIVTVVTGVTNGYIADSKSDRQALKRLYLSLTHGISLITALPLAGLAATADLAVPVLLGDRWIVVVAPLRCLCVGAFFWSLNSAAFQVAANAEKIHSLSISSAAAVPFSLVAYYVGAHFAGTTGAAAAYIAVVIFVATPVIVLANQTSRTSWGEYFSAHVDAAKIIVLVVASTSALRLVIPPTWPMPVKLGTLALGGGLAGGWPIWRSSMPSIVELKSMLLARVARKRRSE